MQTHPPWSDPDLLNRSPAVLQSTMRLRLATPVLRMILILLACYQAYYGLSLQKTLGWDASMGFLTLQSSLEHGDFNRIHHPALGNLAEDDTEFIAWWTPGQYLVPYWITVAMGIDMGTSLRLLSVLCSLGGLFGYYMLYSKLGFRPSCVYLSLIVLCSQHYFLKGSRVYVGGELLLFFAAPYIALAVLSARISLYWRIVIVALACFFALFLKASALTLFLALVIYFAFEIVRWPESPLFSGRDWRIAIRRLLILAGVFTGYVLATDLIYLSKGVTISASAGSMASFSVVRLWGVAVALAGPLFGAFSFIEPYSTTTFYLPMALVGLLIVWKAGTNSRGEQLHNYRRLLFAHFLAFTLFFSYVYLRGMGISYEPRHFRFVGLLLVPGVVHTLLNFRYQATIAGAIATLSLASVALYHCEYHLGSGACASASRWGICQPVSNSSLAAMHRIDDAYVTKDTIVFNGFGTCPALLLEFNHGRRLQDDNLAYFGFKSRDRSAGKTWYRGVSDSMVLIIPKNNTWYFGASLKEIAKTFEYTLRVTPYFENDELVIYQGSALDPKPL